MQNNKITGNEGEQYIVDNIPCPSCKRKLMLLPNSFPLYDVQCTACYFRAQVKTNHSRLKRFKPSKEILGATWDIADKVLKAGFTVPALIVNYKWIENKEEKHAVLFYPFIPRSNLRKRHTTIKKTARKLWMYNFVGLDTLPSIKLE